MSSYLLANYYNDFASALSGMFDDMFTPLITIASALAAVWGIYLGIKFWLSAGDENKRKEAKSAIISFIVGTVVIFAVAVGAPLLIVALTTWLDDSNVASIAVVSIDVVSIDVAGIDIAGGMQYLSAVL